MHTQHKNLLATAPLPAQREKLLTTAEAAEFLGLKPNTLAIWRLTKRYSLTYIRVGRLVKYRMSDLQTYINRQSRNVEVFEDFQETPWQKEKESSL